MKTNILILCLISCLNISEFRSVKLQPVQPFHQELTYIDLDAYDNVMIVAHPDDESIWGGAHLNDESYLVICLTNANNLKRKKEFFKALSNTPSTGVILDYPDKTNGHRDNWDISLGNINKDLNYILTSSSWKQIVTHNPKGEYGHLQHILTNNTVKNICIDQKLTDNLLYFGHYYKVKNYNKISVPSLSSSSLDSKEAMLKAYSSQEKTLKKLQHMIKHESWIPYSEWE